MVFIKRPDPNGDFPANIRKHYAGDRFSGFIGMKVLQHPVFILCAALWIINQLLELNSVYVWPLHAYLDDLICFPLILTFILAVQRSYFKNDKMIMPISKTAFAVAAFAFCFELVLPRFREVYTADVLDVIAYSIGAIIFQLFINKPSASVPVN